MIEIIREENWEHTAEKKALPKDIKQIGRPDIGDRIYVEDHVYQFLHPYESQNEKTAYVLLGRFENYAGRQCTFVEAAIRLEEMDFEGELPLWNDQTWAYIYKKLKKEYESMVIVGWAMDIKGQLPNMTVRIEGMHQNHFGGVHQVLFLMDTLEKEENFYGSRSGHLYRREGFYIYYDKHIPDQLNGAIQQIKGEREKIPPHRDEGFSEEASAMIKGNPQEGEYPFAGESQQDEGYPFVGEGLLSESFPLINEGQQGDSLFQNDAMRNETLAADQEYIYEDTMGVDQDAEDGRTFEDELKFSDSEPLGEEFRSDDDTVRVGTYRKKIMEKEEKQKTPSYAYSLLLAVIVCVLGITAFQNYQKMNAMEATLAQMKGGQPAAADQKQKAEQGDVSIESVSGTIKKQDTDRVSDEKKEKEAKQEPERDGTEKQEKDQDQTAQDSEPAKETEKQETGQEQAEGGGKPGQQDSASEPKETAKADQTQEDKSKEPEKAENETKDKPATAEAQTYLEQGYYIVQKGENLAGICRKIYQTTAIMDKLCEMNDIEDKDAIFAGQYLKLPK